MEKAPLNGYMVLFWIILVVCITQGVFIGFSVNKNHKLQATINASASAANSQESASASCALAVHQKWDSLIDREMGFDPSLAYQYKASEQDQLNQC